LSITLFEKIPLLQALSSYDDKEPEVQIDNQLNLFN